MPPKRKFPPCPTPFTDHVFKTEHGVDVPLRVWPSTSSAGGKRPWVLWFHGGGFTFGKHYHPNPWVLPAFRSAGYHVVSAAYRFLPHVSLWDVIADGSDAFAWCRAHLARVIGQHGREVDVDRYVVAGDSMGGLLVTLAGHNYSPAPTALVCMYPFTHPEDEYFHPPAGHPFAPVARLGDTVVEDRAGDKARAALADVVGTKHAPLPPAVLGFVRAVNTEFKRRAADPNYDSEMPRSRSVRPPAGAGGRLAPSLPREGAVPAMAALSVSGEYTPVELYAFLMSRDPSRAAIAGAFRHELPPVMSTEALREYWGMPGGWAPPRGHLWGDAMIFEYAARLMIRTGGRREEYGTDDEWFAALHEISAIEVAKKRGEEAARRGERLAYPPTFFVHGTADTVVPCYHSQRLAGVLKRHGVRVEERYADGEPHNFDLDIFDESSPKWARFIAPCVAFVDAAMGEAPARGQPEKSRL